VQPKVRDLKLALTAASHTLNTIAGAAGQRCMSISIAVLVGDAKEFLPRFVERASKLHVNGRFEPNTDLYVFSPSSRTRVAHPGSYRGPVISPAAKEGIIGLVSSAEPEGGKVLLDGRDITVEAYPDGNLVGPTVIEANTTVKCYNEEIFGPVPTILHAKILDEAPSTRTSMVTEPRFSFNLAPLLGNSKGRSTWDRSESTFLFQCHCPCSRRVGTKLARSEIYRSTEGGGIDFYTQNKARILSLRLRG
jgi:hypothetical protein